MREHRQTHSNEIGVLWARGGPQGEHRTARSNCPSVHSGALRSPASAPPSVPLALVTNTLDMHGGAVHPPQVPREKGVGT